MYIENNQIALALGLSPNVVATVRCNTEGPRGRRVSHTSAVYYPIDAVCTWLKRVMPLRWNPALERDLRDRAVYINEENKS
jgi:hypothetical protein